MEYSGMVMMIFSFDGKTDCFVSLDAQKHGIKTSTQ
jgi:hypothetical protein